MESIPIITIIGVPNTGKSTLYNRLLGQRKSLVHSLPGMTRDIIRGRAEINDKAYYIQDSGGFLQEKNSLSMEINRRIFREVERSDLVIFLFDGKRDIFGYEKEFFLQLKKTNRLHMAVVNKVDHPDTYFLPDSLYFLKGEHISISAEHNINLDHLVAKLEELVHAPNADQSPAESSMRITIVGKPNVGKSSIVNRMLNDEWVIVSPKPGTTRDSIDLEIRRNHQTFTIVDNAGIRKLQKIKEGTESAAVIRAEKYIRRADIVIFVIDLSRPIDQNDLLIAKKIIQSAKPVIIAGNKWDLIVLEQKKHDLHSFIYRTFNQLYFAPYVSVSAQTNKNIFNLIDRAESIHRSLKEKIKTKPINDWVRQILMKKRLFSADGKPFIPKFVSIESQSPLFLIFHGKSVGRLRADDEMFLKKAILKELKLDGIPVFFKTVSTKN